MKSGLAFWTFAMEAANSELPSGMNSSPTISPPKSPAATWVQSALT